MNVLLTGGSGFIGRHLRESLAEKHTVVAPSHRELDVTDSAAVDRLLRTAQFDAVIHAAVEGGGRVLDSTLRGYWNLSRNANRVFRLVYFGSGAEFGKHRDLVKVSEMQIGEETPRDDYGFAKLLCNAMCRQSTNIVNLRLFGIYGAYEGYAAKFISNTVAKALVGLPVMIRQDVVFDYLWIDDLVRLMPVFLEGEQDVPDVNVTPTESVLLSQIATLVLSELRLPVHFEIETPGLNFQYTGCNQRLLAIAAGFQFTPVAEGIRQLLAYYRTHLDVIDRDALAEDAYRRRCASRPVVASTMGDAT